MKRFTVLFVITIFYLINLNLFASQMPKVYVIKKLEFQEINRWYFGYIKRSLEKASKDGATLIVLELDTPGGTLSDALAIKNMLIESDIPIVTYINKNALSAGALIALSTEAIYMSDGSVIGAATPIYLQGGEIKKAGEKEMSAMRAAMRSSAERRGKNVKAAEAMVDETIVLTAKVDGISLDVVTLLTLSRDEAIKVNIADAKANSIKEIIELRGLPEETVITTIEENKYDAISRYLISPVVLTILLAIGIIGIYIEIKTPGFGVGGVVAIICFSLFFFAQISVGGATWFSPAIFILGAVLLIIEIFLIPGFGITGVAGIIAMVGSMFLSFGVSNIYQGTLVIFFALLISIVFMIIIARYLPNSKLFNSRFALEADTSGYYSSVSYQYLLNMEGFSDTFFRPAGILNIDGKRYDAVSDGEFIKRGSRVKVVLIEGNRIVVKEIKD